MPYTERKRPSAPKAGTPQPLTSLYAYFRSQSSVFSLCQWALLYVWPTASISPGLPWTAHAATHTSLPTPCVLTQEVSLQPRTAQYQREVRGTLSHDACTSR
jgi:hypothetical protein